MQNDHVLKKLTFDLLSPSPAGIFFFLGGGGGAAVQIFATMLLHT